MSRVRVHNFAVSLDGFGTGDGQTREAPFGHAGTRLLDWAFPTRTFTDMGFHGEQPGTTGIDEAFASRWNTGIGAEIMGRNKFAPKPGPWPDDDWKGWWGDTPPFHTPVVVLTHHPRPPLEMEGGTTFYFVTDGIESALRQAREAAGEGNISIAGGASTVNQYLAAGLIDELHIHIVPITLGAGTRLFDGVPSLNLEQIESRTSYGVTHIAYRVLRPKS